VAEGDLSDVFSQVCGFYIYYSDEKIPEAVSNWNVRKLALHKDNRHLDMTVLLDLYRHLDTFLSARKSSLAF
jgi:parafibromin